MNRKTGRILVTVGVTAVAAALALGLAPFFGQQGLGPKAWAGIETHDADHDLSALRLFNRVVLLVRDHYVEPDRFHPKEMLLASLDAVEKRVAEVLVDERQAMNTGKVTVTVGTATKTFDISQVNSLWDMSFRLKDIFEFIQKHLVSTTDTSKIEYAAINGMLATLDPHSNLLDPEQYAEMKMHTRGEFGGLGFVVSIVDGKLTVMQVLKHTPASRGGVKAKDVITRIEDESTINMDLTEAVNHLRGKPGTQVSFWIARKAFKEPHKFTLTRAQITIDSIDPAKLLSGNVGYIRITNFQGNTTREMRKAIKRLTAKAGGKLAGLVLDLRNNPGGLLDQAIHVVDTFVSHGTIVATVGQSAQLREKRDATEPGTLSNLPLVVLVNHNSASASEIVSGALKYRGRAIIVGQQTFGKGSVQVLYDLFDESALKLTIAEYLAAGNVSIQQHGVTPDIRLRPAVVTKKDISVFAPERSMRERELEEEMLSGVQGAAPGAKLTPFVTSHPRKTKSHSEAELTYLADAKTVADDDEGFAPTEWKEDFQVRLARDLILKAGADTRAAFVKKALPVVDADQKAEQARIEKAIAALGVNWTDAGAPTHAGPPKVTVHLAAKGKAQAGSKVDLVLTVKNDGKTPLDRVHAWTESTDSIFVPGAFLFDRLEFVIGHLAPGQTGQWTVPVDLPEDLPARTEQVKIHLEAAGHAEMEPVAATVATSGLPDPRFLLSWEVDDASGGNGDGMLTPGETVHLLVHVKNAGAGKALETIASLKNLENEKVYISKGRHHIGALAVGATGDAPMIFSLKQGYGKDLVKMRLTVFDAKIGEVTSDDIEIPVTRHPGKATAVGGAVRLTHETPVLAWAKAGGEALARAPRGAVLPVSAKIDGYWRVTLGGGRDGFVPVADARHLGGHHKAAGRIADLWPIQPPVIQISGHPVSLKTDADRMPFKGRVTDPAGIRDMYVFLNNQKVFFKAHKAGDPDTLGFDTQLPLTDGLNYIVVFARKNDDLMSRRTVMVWREKAAVAQHGQEPTGQ